MKKQESIATRKAAQLQACLNPKDNSQIEGNSAGFEKFEFHHCAFPELDTKEIDITTTFLDKTIQMPFFISSITGGSKEGLMLNKMLASVAGQLGIPMCTGSARILLENPKLVEQFALKKYTKNSPLLINISAVQVRDNDFSKIDELISMCEADGLIIHLNAGQELFQKKGDSDFRGLKKAVSDYIKHSKYPVVVKETGFGISVEESKFLLDSGASYVDIAGSGGTNWIAVENECNDENEYQAEFANWGYKTADLLAMSPVESGKILASGGIRSGMDAVKALALGAKAVGIALPVVRLAYSSGEEGVISYYTKLKKILLAVMTLTSTKKLSDLKIYKKQ